MLSSTTELAARWVAIDPILSWGTMVATFGLAILYSRHAEPKIAASLQQIAEKQDDRMRENSKEAPKHAVG